MTRKQAISMAISILEKEAEENGELRKVIMKLEEMKNGIPGKLWDDKAIRSAIERFIAKNGRCV